MAEVYPEPGKRRCSLCRTAKPLADFCTKANGYAESRCKLCKRAENRAIREAARGKPDLTAPERFWKKVHKTEGCWQWTGSKKEDGYGFFVYQGRTTRAHRVALILSGVDVPDYDGGSATGLVVDHICKNVSCVRPDHLRLVPQADNCTTHARDTSPFKRNRAAEKCVNGHPFEGANLAVRTVRGRKGRSYRTRICLTCWPGHWRYAVIPRDPPPAGYAKGKK
jgi:hypothetical protein